MKKRLSNNNLFRNGHSWPFGNTPHTLTFLVAAIGFVITFYNNFAFAADTNNRRSYLHILKELGEPKEKIEKESKREDVWLYPLKNSLVTGEKIAGIVFVNGLVTKRLVAKDTLVESTTKLKKNSITTIKRTNKSPEVSFIDPTLIAKFSQPTESDPATASKPDSYKNLFSKR